MDKMPMPPQGGMENEAGDMPHAEGAQPGGASQLVADIHTKMMDLMDLMSQSQQVDDSDKQGMAQVIQAFQSVIEGLGAAPGQKPEGPAPKGPVPVEAGAADVKPAM